MTSLFRRPHACTSSPTAGSLTQTQPLASSARLRVITTNDGESPCVELLTRTQCKAMTGHLAYDGGPPRCSWCVGDHAVANGRRSASPLTPVACSRRCIVRCRCPPPTARSYATSRRLPTPMPTVSSKPPLRSTSIDFGRPIFPLQCLCDPV